MPITIPPFATFPQASWRTKIAPEEWEECLPLWVSLISAHLKCTDADFANISAQDESFTGFLLSYIKELAASGPGILGSSNSASLLFQHVYFLIARLLGSSFTPSDLSNWEFLCNFSKTYGKKRASPVLADFFKKSSGSAETSLNALKKTLIQSLDLGIKGDLRISETRLRLLNHLVHVSPETAALLLAGSDYLDGLISCYKVMNPPLRKVIITNAYLCIIGLTEGENPKFSMLTDQLYSLNEAANAHKAGPTSANDSMVAELVTSTPILKQVQNRLEASGSGSSRAKSVIMALESFKKPGGMMRAKKLVKRKIDKGKGVMNLEGDDDLKEMRVHRMSQISQIRDLFPDLGSAFVSALLDEYSNDTEQVIAHLLEESLPPHLAKMDRHKELESSGTRRRRSSLVPRSTPPQLPVRHNVFDGDELDRLAHDVSSLRFGKQNLDKTADDMLKDRSTAPNKAAILSALSAFDADDDERDDTYDAADAGFVVNDALADDADDQKRGDAIEEILFKVYQADPKLLGRDSDTRRGNYRAKLKQDTGVTDEAVEGWGLMLSRDPARIKRLDTKYGAFSATQNVIASTSWRANAEGSDARDSSGPEAGGSGPRGGGSRGRGRGGRGRGGGGGGGGRGGGDVSGPTGEKDTTNARRNKESNKGSRANHNRRDQRAKKMARGGFAG